MRAHVFIATTFSLTLTAAAVATLVACSAKPTDGDLHIEGPAVPDFVENCRLLEGGTGQTCGVSAMLERRCGSLDCHGFVRRPFRVYSKFGLRLPPLEGDASVEPGTGDTTPEERSANYRSAVGVEPEQTQAVAKAGANPNTLLLYKKPLNVESHKGGVAINKGDDAETCLVSWLKGVTDKVACGKAAELP